MKRTSTSTESNPSKKIKMESPPQTEAPAESEAPTMTHTEVLSRALGLSESLGATIKRGSPMFLPRPLPKTYENADGIWTIRHIYDTHSSKRWEIEYDFLKKGEQKLEEGCVVSVSSIWGKIEAWSDWAQALELKEVPTTPPPPLTPVVSGAGTEVKTCDRKGTISYLFNLAETEAQARASPPAFVGEVNKEEEKKEEEEEEEEEICPCKWRKGDPKPANTMIMLLSVAQDDGGTVDHYELKGSPKSINAIQRALVMADKEKTGEEITSFNFLSLLDYVLGRQRGEQYQNGDWLRAMDWEGDEGEDQWEKKMKLYFGCAPPNLYYKVEGPLNGEDNCGLHLYDKHSCMFLSCTGFH